MNPPTLLSDLAARTNTLQNENRTINLFLLVFASCLLFLSSANAQSGCNPGESSVVLYTSYGIQHTSNAYVANPERSIGYTNTQYARLNSSFIAAQRGDLVVELTDVVPAGDTIWFRSASDISFWGSNYRVSSSFNGVSFADVVSYSTPTPGHILREESYVVVNPAGIKYMRFLSNDAFVSTRIESVNYKRKECYTYCGFESINYTNGTSNTFNPGSTAGNPGEAVGLPNSVSSELEGDNDEYLVLDLTDTIPYGAYIQLYLARDANPVPIQVSASFNGSTFTAPITIYPDHQFPVHSSYFYNVGQLSGVRYLKFVVLLDNTKGYVDGVDYIFPKIFGKNVISGYVYDDVNSNGIKNIGETGAASIDLSLYLDVNSNSKLDAGDQLITTTSTVAGGGYLFETYSLETDYLVVVDPQTLPAATALTMDAVQPLVFSRFNEGACLDFSYENCSGNCPAEAYDDVVATPTNTAVNINVLANDRGDINAASVSTAGLLQPAHGSTLVGPGGVIIYTPDPNYSGNDVFEYVICANWAPFTCDTARVTVSMTCVVIPGQNTINGIIFDDIDQDGIFDAGETWSYPDILTIDVYNDANSNGIVDGGETIAATAFTDGTGNYQFNLTNSAADYVVLVDTASVPAGAAFTSPLFYAVSFTGGGQAFCGNNIGFAFCAPSCPVIAIDDNYTMDQGTSIFMDVSSNDIDFDGDFDLSSIQLTTKPLNGNIMIRNDGQIIYIPNGVFTGVDAFDYVICDQQSPVASCDTATVTITVEINFFNPCSEAVREHTYYLPYPEDDLRGALINASSVTCAAYLDNIARSITTVKCPYPGTEIVYDHWEDGYESDIANPVQATTLIWGDGNLNNGVVPGYPDDIIPSGGNIVLDNNLVWNPRNPATIVFDGKDKMLTSGDIALSRIVGDLGQFHVQAAKTDVYDINRFGTSFTVPFGENLGNEFQYSSLFIRAGENGAQVSVDKDNDGLADELATLAEGEVMFVDGGVRSGATVSSTQPVGVDALFGGLDCYGTRQISVLPADFYSSTYYTPVPTTLGSAPAAIYFYNSLPGNMTINWYSAYNTGSFVINATSTYKFNLTDNSGYKFINPGGQSYTAMEVVDADANGDDYDWSFNLIAAERLTEFASIAWAPGSRDGSRNYNPVWVTPTANTTLYIKYDGDMVDETALQSPCGVPYDHSVSLGELQYYQVFDNTDKDQSGVTVYTCDGTEIVAVYGEDPNAGSPTPTASPALDVGTTIQPMCLQMLILATNDKAVCPPDDFVVIDVLDNDYGFLTDIDTTSVSTFGLLQPANGNLTINANGTITYTPDPGFEGEDVFEYTVCSDDNPGLCDIATVYITISPCVATADENLVNGYVYLELNPDDGIYYDEDRMPGFLVNLWGDTDCDGEIDVDERVIETTTSNASGAYTFSTINGQFAKDDFDNDYGAGSGNDGSIVWDNNWQEIGETNGFTNDPVYINNDAIDGDTALVLNGANNGASRTITFGDMLQVTLQFNYRRQSMEDSGEELQVRVNGYTVYSIGDGDGIGSDAYPVPVEFTVPISLINQGGANTISFHTNSSTSNGDYFYIDDVNFIFTTEDVCYITEVDVADKNNAYLVAALNTDTASFAGLGSCANGLYLGVLANIVASDDYGAGAIDNPFDIDVLFNDIGETDPLSVEFSGLMAPSNGAASANIDGSVRYTPDPGFDGVDSFDYRVYSLEDPSVSDVATVYVKISCLVVEGSNSISGSIFHDYNEDGTFDAGESLIPDVTVYLYIDENNNGILDGTEGDVAIDTVQTPTGNYDFIIDAPEQTTVLSIPVIRSVDDAEQRYYGAMVRYSVDLDLNNYYPYAGIRFQGVDIPQGAVVTSARLKLEAANTRSSGVNLRVSIQDDDMPPAFSRDYYNISNRWDPTNTVDWFNVEPWVNGSDYYTPDLTSIVQQVINRNDWNSGDNLAFIIRYLSGNERNIRSYNYDNSSAHAPVLEIAYGENSYPVSYIVQVDPNSFPGGSFMTTDNLEDAFFNVPDESDCRNNFGIAMNTVTAVDDISVTLRYVPVNGNVLTNDIDKEGDEITFNSFLAQNGSGDPIPSGTLLTGDELDGGRVAPAGILNFNANGEFNFVPDSSFIGKVVISYFACDNGAVNVCDTASLTVSVLPFTNPNLRIGNSITAENDIMVCYGTATRNSNVLMNDKDPELDNIIMQDFMYDSDGDGVPDKPGIFSAPTFVGGVDSYGKPDNKAGSITMFGDGFFLFTPEPGFYGKATLEYSICDDYELPFTACASAYLIIDVIQPPFGISNLPPFAGDDYASTPINHPVTANWIDNDADEDGIYIELSGTGVYIDPLNLGVGTEIDTYVTEKGGSVKFMDDGNFEYQPPLHYYGPDKFRYSICDSNVAAECDSATIYLNVTPIRFDFGDLGPEYQSAAHMIPFDEELDGIPDMPGSIWLGQIIDAEVSAKESFDADGDDLDFSNDEQGVVFPSEITPGQDAAFKVIVNGIDPGMTVHYGIWIDWDVDGTFDDFYKGSGITQDEFQRNRDSIIQPITVPAVLPSTTIFFRARAFSSEPDILDFGALMRSGEAEDYRWDISGLLPVELTDFDAEAQGNDVELTWNTASELNNDYFSVQRSADAIHWEQIGIVEGFGTTADPHNYRLPDMNLSSGRYYYRLQQFDFGGASEFSPIESVLIEGDADEFKLENVTVYPNPLHKQSELQFDGLLPGDANVKLVSLDGKLAFYGHLENDNHVLDLSAYPIIAGFYFMVVEQDDLQLDKKIFIMD
ncbi:MAG: tandem-95 repeat protein [Bacteroidetes bacterium]|nr:tandem-95 repeat protein [Bacteroidota bacterium]